MKKIVGVVAFLLIGFASQAQFTIGLKAGANLSNLKASVGDVNVSFDSKTGFHGGVFIRNSYTNKFSMQLEALYSEEGAKYDEFDSKISLSCINLPVMFQYHLSNLILEAGPQLTFLNSAKENGQNATEAYEKMSAALGLGVAYSFYKGLGINARYNIGLSGVAKDDSQNAVVKSNVFQFGLILSLVKFNRN